ncbi:dnaJ homolog subfamily C member 17 [Prionailurus iriomotensis]
MAVTKELLQMDLYALLGIEEKAADKEDLGWALETAWSSEKPWSVQETLGGKLLYCHPAPPLCEVSGNANECCQVLGRPEDLGEIHR